MAQAASLLCLLAALCTCRALEVYHCDERGNIHPEDYELTHSADRPPCILTCCGKGRTNRRPDITFSAGGERLDGSFLSPTCTYNDTGGFICSTKSLRRCFREKYVCTIQQGNVNQSAEILVDQQKIDDEATHQLCQPPVITKIFVTKQVGNRVLVSWNYTKYYNQPYCVGTRRFRVKMKRYERYNDAANDDTNLVSQDHGYHDIERRVTNYTFDGVYADLFYRFLVRARRTSKAEAGAGVRILYNDPVYTPVQHFALFARLSWDKNCLTLHHAVVGEVVTISCGVTGIPTPLPVTYQRKGSNHLFTAITMQYVSLGDNGTYVAKACHRVFHNDVGRFIDECTSIDIDLIVIPRQKDRNCISYAGADCSEFLHRDMKVFLGNNSHSFRAELAQFAQLSGEISETCRQFVMSAFCHITLAYCNPFTLDEGQFSPLPICPKTCAELRTRCGDEIERHGREFANVFATKCDPELHTGGPGDLPGCIYIDPRHPFRGGPEMDPVSNDIAALECTLGNGHDYRGRVKYTSSGVGCQSWSRQVPHRHHFTKMMVGELEGAGRYCRNPGGLGEGPWCFVSDPNTGQRWGYCDVPVCEQCVPYGGEFCQPVGYTNSTSVLLQRQLKDSVADMELELRGTLHAVQEELTPGCEMLARQLLCSGALPTCENGNKLEMCEKQCDLLDMLLVCSQDLQMALRSISYINFSVCRRNRSSLLPFSHPSCLPTPVLIPDTKGTLNEGCHNVSTLGQTYTGELNVTQDGKNCLPWRATPSARGLVETCPELNGAFCRNPGQLGRKPWCFTSTAGDWEYCNVTLCSAPTTSAITSQQTRDQSGVVVGSALATVFVVAVLVVLAVAIFVWKWKLSQQKGERDRVGPSQNIGGYSNGYSNGHHKTGLSPTLLQITQSFRKIEKSKIRYLQEIGQGHFGTVFQGECDWIKRNNSSDEETGETVKVAVKTIKSKDDSDRSIEEFVREAKIVHQFNHPNVVEFYGVCMDELPYYMVFEYMNQGDLCQYIRERGSSAQRRYNPPRTRTRNSSSSSNFSNDSASLGVTDLLDICKQVVSGMAYLESENYIHRDLAARNCLVNSGTVGPVVKIADFGMSKNLYSSDYYRMSNENSLPIRWMAPEALIYGKFSTKADVWAFGVVVWEVFSFGLQPYWGNTNESVMEMVRSGKLLNRPDCCPDKLFSLVKGGCWSFYEYQRMSFKTLETQLRSFRLSDSDISQTSMETENDDVFDANSRLDDDDSGD